MKILITGASGFVGRHLCAHLGQSGQEIVAIYRGALPNRDATGSVEICLAKEDGLPEIKLLRNIDCIVHLAGRAHVMKEMAANEEAVEQAYMQANRDLTLRLAERALDNGVQRFIFVSTIKVMGEQQSQGRPYTERDAPAPSDPYSRSKYEAEQGLVNICQAGDMSYVIIRPPLIYGPGVGANFESLLKLARSGIPLPLGSIDNRRSMLSVFNLCDFIAICMENRAACDKVFLLADPEDYSTEQLVAEMRRAMGRPERIFCFPERILRLLLQISGKAGVGERLLGSLQVDSHYACDVLDWQPRWNLANTLQEMLSETKKCNGDLA